jgi:uncharacterized protein
MRPMTITDAERQAEAQRQIEEARALVAGPRRSSAAPSFIGTFFTGLALAVVGGYLVLNQVEVTSSFAFFGVGGRAGFGLTLLPLLFGVGVLFFDGKSKPGWFLSIAGALGTLAAILMSLSISWQSTTLFNTLLMFTLLAAGVGLVLRSLRPEPRTEEPT